MHLDTRDLLLILIFVFSKWFFSDVFEIDVHHPICVCSPFLDLYVSHLKDKGKLKLTFTTFSKVEH